VGVAQVLGRLRATLAKQSTVARVRLRETGCGALILVSSGDVECVVGEFVAELRLSAPALFVGAIAVNSEAGDCLRLAREHRLDTVVLPDLAGAGLLSAAIQHAAGTPRIARLLADGRLPSGRAGRVVEYIFGRPHAKTSIDGIAAAFGLSRSSVKRTENQTGMPLGEVIEWAHYTTAAAELEGTLLSIEAVANILHFPSGSALQNGLKRYVGVNPTELRRTGGAGRVFDEFCAVMKGERPAMHSRPQKKTRDPACSTVTPGAWAMGMGTA
jgi:AraC-like DNA-binding protein